MDHRWSTFVFRLLKCVTWKHEWNVYTQTTQIRFWSNSEEIIGNPLPQKKKYRPDSHSHGLNCKYQCLSKLLLSQLKISFNLWRYDSLTASWTSMSIFGCCSETSLSLQQKPDSINVSAYEDDMLNIVVSSISILHNCAYICPMHCWQNPPSH